MKRLPESELEIMIIIWEAKQPVNVAYIMGNLGEQRTLTASALHSYLNRLLEKGFLSCKKQGKTSVYEVIISDEEYQKKESKSVLERLYQGSIKNFVAALHNGDNLTKEDLLELKNYIEEHTTEED